MPRHMFCFECSQHVNLEDEADLRCPHCDGEFLEEMPPDANPPPYIGYFLPIFYYIIIFPQRKRGKSPETTFSSFCSHLSSLSFIFLI